MALYVLAWDDTTNRRKRTTFTPNGGTSGKAGEVALSANSTSATIAFSSAQPDTTYVLSVSFVNLVDVSPQYQTVIVTAKTVNGFTASWNSGLDSSNYKLAYAVTAAS